VHAPPLRPGTPGRTRSPWKSRFLSVNPSTMTPSFLCGLCWSLLRTYPPTETEPTAVA